MPLDVALNGKIWMSQKLNTTIAFCKLKIFSDTVGQPESWSCWERIHRGESQSRPSHRSELSVICGLGSALIQGQSNLVSWYLKLHRTYIYLSCVSSSFKVVFVLTILQFADRSEDQNFKMCKSWTWLICNQFLNMRARCWVFVSLCFIHVYVHLMYSTAAFTICIWW